ncbi:unnamed protein product, partial [Owenia fusiformis]
MDCRILWILLQVLATGLFSDEKEINISNVQETKDELQEDELKVMFNSEDDEKGIKGINGNIEAKSKVAKIRDSGTGVSVWYNNTNIVPLARKRKVYKRLTKDLEMFLHGQRLRDRLEVWKTLAIMQKIIATIMGRPESRFNVEESDLYEGDVVLRVEDLLDEVHNLEENFEIIASSVTRKFETSQTDPIDNARNELKKLKQRLQRRSQKHSSSMRRNKRSILTKNSPRKRVYTYRISKSYNTSETDRIVQGMVGWANHTCLSFKPWVRGKKLDLFFFRGRKCSSPIGVKGTNRISLDTGCLTPGLIQHEIGHSLGLIHQHSRPDRNTHIKILFSRIRHKLSPFVKSSWTRTNPFGVPYDLSSVMHYPSAAFGISPRTITMETIDKEKRGVIGQRNGISFWDARVINMYYCSNQCVVGGLDAGDCNNYGYLHPGNCQICLCQDGWSGTRCSSIQEGSPEPCGGEVVAMEQPQFLNSPGFNQTNYTHGQQCSWLITTTPGDVILMKFIDNFGIIPPQGTRVRTCEDYVEIRYKHLATVGPRFCGSTRPTQIFISHSNRVMVLFRANNPITTSGDQGFKLEYTRVRCGGCTSTLPISQPVCQRTTQHDCSVQVRYASQF